MRGREDRNFNSLQGRQWKNEIDSTASGSEHSRHSIMEIGSREGLVGEMQMWKQLLPALVERCRVEARDNCKYQSQGTVPLADVMMEDPLCSCGRERRILRVCLRWACWHHM